MPLFDCSCLIAHARHRTAPHAGHAFPAPASCLPHGNGPKLALTHIYTHTYTHKHKLSRPHLHRYRYGPGSYAGKAPHVARGMRTAMMEVGGRLDPVVGWRISLAGGGEHDVHSLWSGGLVGKWWAGGEAVGWWGGGGLVGRWWAGGEADQRIVQSRGLKRLGLQVRTCLCGFAFATTIPHRAPTHSPLLLCLA